MNTVSRYLRIAQISRAKGLLGEVVVISDYGLPLRFWDEVTFAIVPPQHDVPRSCTVETATAQNDGESYLLKLSDINDRTTAAKVVGCYLLAPTEACQGIEVLTSESLKGTTVVDKTYGEIGTIVEERFGIAQDIWVVEGNFGEVLIPAVEDFIVSRCSEVITVDLPQGLLELNN